MLIIILVLERLRQEDPKSTANLGSSKFQLRMNQSAILCLKKKETFINEGTGNYMGWGG